MCNLHEILDCGIKKLYRTCQHVPNDQRFGKNGMPYLLHSTWEGAIIMILTSQAGVGQYIKKALLFITKALGISHVIIPIQLSKIKGRKYNSMGPIMLPPNMAI